MRHFISEEQFHNIISATCEPLLLWITHCTPLTEEFFVDSERPLCWAHQYACVSPPKGRKG